MLEGKTVLLGISGGIAAYKSAMLARMLVKAGARVETLMTQNACRFIAPLTFETLTGNKCHTDTFDRNFKFDVEHISLAKRADLFLIAPATANVIAKTRAGIADDMLTTVFLAANCPKMIAPAMNSAMYLNPATQENLRVLEERGIAVLAPGEGHLACGDEGPGRMPEPEVLFAHVECTLTAPKDLRGKKVLITAGATREFLDPVRFLSNPSSGRMGFALAREAAYRGADVTLVKAFTTAPVPPFVRVIDVTSTEEMFAVVKEIFPEQDIVCKAAAVSDYTPVSVAEQKIKKKDGNMLIECTRTPDILAYLGTHKREDQFLCGFSMETENMIENSRAKLNKKNADMIVANNLKEAGAGFEKETNVVTLITRDAVKSLPIMSKEKVAQAIFNTINSSRK